MIDQAPTVTATHHRPAQVERRPAGERAAPTPRPVALPILFANIPPELAALAQWVGWRYRWTGAKWTKAPITPATGRLASTSDPATWGTLAQARALVEAGRADGVGVVLTPADPFAAVDLDDCLTGDELAADAARIVAGLDSYAERSPSGRGVRVFVAATLPPHGRRNKARGVEVYDARQFLTVTGQRLASAPASVKERQGEVEALHAELFPVPTPQRTAPSSAEALALDDATLIEKAHAAKNGATFARLWAGDWSAHEGAENRSGADLALCGMLAFWTSGDEGRMDRLFRASGLMRPKWDARRAGGTYGERTIARALAGCSTFYNAQPPERRDYVAEALAFVEATNWIEVARHTRELAQAEREAGQTRAKGCSADTLRGVFLALVKAMRDQGNEGTAQLSWTEATQAAGRGKESASNALRWLQRLGWWTVSAEHTALDATTYQLKEGLKPPTLAPAQREGENAPEDVPPTPPLCNQEGGLFRSVLPAPDLAIIEQYQAHDAFLRGARIAEEYAGEERPSLGPLALDALATLVEGGEGFSASDIAHALGGRNAQTIARKLRELATWGLVEVVGKAGRALLYRRAGDWRERLDMLRSALTTFGRGVLRSLEACADRVANHLRVFRSRTHHPAQVQARQAKVLEEVNEIERDLLNMNSPLAGVARVVSRLERLRDQWGSLLARAKRPAPPPPPMPPVPPPWLGSEEVAA